MKYPKAATISRLHDYIIKSQGGASGPLNPNLLQAALARPKTQVYGFEPYRDLIAKVSALAYGIITWHPFLDGNKRTAIATMALALNANGLLVAIPPYMVKYAVQAAMEPSKGSHLTLEGFTKKIIPLCSPPGFRSRMKKVRYESLPNGILQGYFYWFRRYPRGIYAQALAERLLDWYAAGDKETMFKTLEEWKMAREAGYPKPIPYPNFGEEDFETI